MLSAEDIHKIVQKLSIPRKIGSSGETKTQIQIFSYLKAFGFQPQAEPFDYYNSITKIYQIFFSLLGLTFIISGLLVLNQQYFLPPILLLLAGGISYILIQKILRGKLNKPWGPKFQSKNIRSEQKSSSHKEFDAPIAKIIIISHYDSIGTRFNGPIYEHFLSLFGFCGIFTFISNLILVGIVIWNKNPQIIQFFSTLSYIFSSITLFGIIIILCNQKNNFSSGACDNASGCAVNLAIAERCHELKTALKWCDLEFLFVSGEEIGLWGSNAYTKMHFSELLKYRDVYVINLDMIGSEIGIIQKRDIFGFKSLNSYLNELIEHNAMQIKIPISKYRSLLVAGSDHLSFLENNFEVACFISLKDHYIHSFKDNPQRVDPQKLKDALELIFNLIHTIERRIDDKINSGE